MPLTGPDVLVVYLCRSNSLSCSRGCYTRSDSLTDIHSLKKIEYKFKAVLLEMTTKKWDI